MSKYLRTGRCVIFTVGEFYRKIKAERRRQQEKNVAQKLKMKETEKEQARSRIKVNKGSGVTAEPDDDVAYFKEEVGEEPDPGLWFCPDHARTCGFVTSRISFQNCLRIEPTRRATRERKSIATQNKTNCRRNLD